MHKNIKWADKELPGLSHEDLLKLNNRTLHGQDMGKLAVENGNIKIFQKSGNDKVKELIENGEWSKISSKGWEGIKDKEKAKEHISFLGKVIAKTDKVKEKIARTKNQKKKEHEEEFYNMLPNQFSNRDAQEIAKSIGKSNKYAQRIYTTRAILVKKTSTITFYKKS